MRAVLRNLLKKGVERGLGAYGYRIVNPASRYGIDVIADVRRLSRLWGVDVATIFDVGANVGRTTMAFRAAWPASRIFAFEPNGSVARALRANVGPLGTVSVEQIALSDRSGRSDFYVHGASELGSLKAEAPYVESHGLRGRTVGVDVTTLDAFCRERSIGRVNLLKIDTEGSDHDVLLGAERALAEGRIDFVTCEFNSLDGDPGRAGSLLPIARLLNGYRYNFIASYNDYIITEGRFFAVSNALFAADRTAVASEIA